MIGVLSTKILSLYPKSDEFQDTETLIDVFLAHVYAWHEELYFN